MPFARATELPTRLRDRLRRITGRTIPAHGSALDPILSWLRTIVLERDVFVLETPEGRRLVRFPFPSEPGSRPGPASEAGADDRVRFIVRAGVPIGAGSEGRPGVWLPVVRLRELEVLERDAPHGALRPLRLGLDHAESAAMLAHVRRCAERFVRGERPADTPPATGDLERLQQGAGVAVAIWTGGQLRGSIVSPPGAVLRTLGQVAVWACLDARFKRLTVADLDDTVFEATLIHAPTSTLSPAEIATADAYHDKAIFVSEGSRAGIYLPEIFNVGPARQRRLSFLTESLARDKAGLAAFGPGARVEVCEVTDVIESPDRTRALRLDGPVTEWTRGTGPDAVRASGDAACAWLARIQREDGAFPQRVHASSGVGEGLDAARTAMTAHALAEFGAAYGVPAAQETARRALSWVTTTRSMGGDHETILVACYQGKAALALSGVEAAEPFLGTVLGARMNDVAALPPLVGAHLLSFLGLVEADRSPAAEVCARLRPQLSRRFSTAKAGGASAALAEWAELAMAPPVSSELSADVIRWLVGQQLQSGAFPDTTTSCFAYSRGTGKIFEVLAASRSPDADKATAAALVWLLGMQYRPDSAFFIPTEHRQRVFGGLRHDYFDTDAWIDAAGHLLLGLARLARP